MSLEKGVSMTHYCKFLKFHFTAFWSFLSVEKSLGYNFLHGPYSRVKNKRRVKIVGWWGDYFQKYSYKLF